MFAPIAFSRTQSFTNPLLRSRGARGIAAATACTLTLGMVAFAGPSAFAEEGGAPVAPVAMPDSVTVPKQTTTWINVADNDSDADSIFFVKDITQPPGGQVYAVENTRFNYQSDYGFCGVDTMTYRLQDTTGLYSEWTTVEITVPNEDPVATDDQKQGAKNVMNSGNVISNDSDADDAMADLSVTWGTPSQPGFTGAAHGAWQWNLGTWGGIATVPYTVHDLCGGTDEGLLTVVVPEYGDDAPVLVADKYSMVQDTVLTVDAPGVLGNDHDPDGSPFTAMIIPSSANHGTVVAHPSDGSFTYTPDAGFVGTDTFIYQAIDSDLHKSAAQTITVTVTPATEPQAIWDLYWTPADTALVVSGEGVLSNDVDAASAEVVNDPAHGTLVFNADGTFTYEPDAGFAGSDSFQYRALNNIGPSNTQTVFIEVGGSKPVWFTPPVAVGDSATTDKGQEIWIKVRDNDTIPVPGGATIVTDPAGAAHGEIVSIHQDMGMVRYRPDAGYAGPDSFSYAIYDSRGVMSNWVTVTIDVTDINNTAPVITDLNLTRTQGDVDPSVGNVFDLITEAEGYDVTIAWDSTPSVGTFVHDVATAGSWQWMPPADYVGVQTIVFTATDALGASAQGTITISVLEQLPVPVQNTAPVAAADTYVADHNTTLTVPAMTGLLINDTDGDADQLTVSGSTLAANGTVTVAADGSFEYTPNMGYAGTDSFEYTVTDGTDTDTATVTITVKAAPAGNPGGNPGGSPVGEPGNPGAESPEQGPTTEDGADKDGSDKDGSGSESTDTEAAATLAEAGDANSDSKSEDAAEDDAVKDEGAASDAADAGAAAGSTTASGAAETRTAALPGAAWLAMLIAGLGVGVVIWIARRLRARSNASAA
jgi:hypothetical protein